MHHGRQVDEDGRRAAAERRAGGRGAVPDDDQRRHHDDGGAVRGARATRPGQHEHQESRCAGAQAGLARQRAAEKGTWHASAKRELLLLLFFFL